jgi:hypothetical protein
VKQWGVSDIGMEAIKNLKMVEAAREEAKNIIEKNQINQFPLLEKTLLERNKITHFE